MKGCGFRKDQKQRLNTVNILLCNSNQSNAWRGGGGLMRGILLVEKKRVRVLKRWTKVEINLYTFFFMFRDKLIFQVKKKFFLKKWSKVGIFS